MRLPYAAFQRTCRKLGGPRKPAHRECRHKKKNKKNKKKQQQQGKNATGREADEDEDDDDDGAEFAPDESDPCGPFLEGYCRYHGSLLEHLERLDSPRR